MKRKAKIVEILTNLVARQNKIIDEVIQIHHELVQIRQDIIIINKTLRETNTFFSSIKCNP